MKKIIPALVLACSLCLLPALAQAQSSSDTLIDPPPPLSSVPPTDDTPLAIEDGGNGGQPADPEEGQAEPQTN